MGNMCMKLFHTRARGSGDAVHSGSYMSAHVLLNLLNKLRKSNKKFKACLAFYRFFATSLINSIIHQYECEILFII